MSDHSLPENMAQWPRDPFALLGLNRGAGRRDARRAYARLIRVYKPEHFPTQFQRIREAFETLDKQLAWFESNGIVKAPISAVPIVSPEAKRPESQQPEQERPQAEKTECAVPIQPPPPTADELWEEARTGRLEPAYRNFARMAAQGSADETAYARLYWLLRIDRQLDPSRDPRGWLVSGMKRLGLHGRLPELYRAELVEDWNEALHPRCDEAIACSGHSGLLVDLIVARWEAAAKLGKWDLFGRDLAAYRVRLQDDSPLWGRVLLAAVDLLAWTNDDDAESVFAACRREVEELAEHWPALAGDLDQRDVLLELVGACDRLTRLTTLSPEWRKTLRRLLLNSWNQPLENFRRLLLEVLAPLVQNPMVGMVWLDRLDAACRPALHRLGGLILMLANDCGVGRQGPPVHELLLRLVDYAYGARRKRKPVRWKKWGNLADASFGRQRLLLFCLEESISVSQLADCLAASQRPDLAKLVPVVGNAPLHFICLAYQAFWA